MLHEHSLCALNGDLLAPGSSFSLHHGDRLLLGPERLFLVSLWKGPLHDGSYHHQGVRAPAAEAAALVSPDATLLHRGHSYSHSPLLSHAHSSADGHDDQQAARLAAELSGGYAFRAEAQSHLKHAEAELFDHTVRRRGCRSPEPSARPQWRWLWLPACCCCCR